MNTAEQAFATGLVEFLGLSDQHISQLQLNIDAQGGINVLARIFPKGFVANQENPKMDFLAFKVNLEELPLEPQVNVVEAAEVSENSATKV